MASLVGAVIGILLGSLFNGLVIWLVAKLRLGLEVDGFLPAYLAALVVAVLDWLVTRLLGPASLGAPPWLAVLISLVVAAVVLYTAGAWIKGFRTKGFTGALVGAAAIAVVGLLVAWLVGIFV